MNQQDQNPPDPDWAYHQPDRKHKIDQVFTKVAPYYDTMNDLMSFGLHRLWKRACVFLAKLGPEQRVLEVACGSGDLSLLIAEKSPARLTLTDPNHTLLQQAQDRLLDQGYICQAVPAYAEQLPFADAHFDHVFISFGLRNATSRSQALKEFYRVLAPGGHLTILECNQPTAPILRNARSLWMTRCIIPLADRLFNDRASYQYLEESINHHPNSDALLQELSAHNFRQPSVVKLSGGLVALFRAVR